MRKRSGFLIVFTISITLLITVNVTNVLALYSTYNRPNPLLDYVPQEVGFFDTQYNDLEESDCRRCHGNSMADRHHGLNFQRDDLGCLDCHDLLCDAPFVTVIYDCTTSGCHSPDDINETGERWHHNTDQAAALNCVACHNPNLVSKISPLRDFTMYPPTIVTPTPFSCENCHWEQDVSGDHPEGPSGSYGKRISSNYDTHHMGFIGNVSSECTVCHSIDPEYQNWNSSDPELIRYCEKCHDINTLHSIEGHVKASDEWEAVGAHVGGSIDWTDSDATVYSTIQAGDKCNGCHADGAPDSVPPINPVIPAINSTADGIMPHSGSCGIYVTVRGDNFGSTQTESSEVQISNDGVTWTDMPIDSWTQTLIKFKINCNVVAPGNYNVRVRTDAGYSNRVSFGLTDGPSLSSINPKAGSIGDWITISGNGFGSAQTEMYDDDYGVYRFVEMVDSAAGIDGNYVMLNYQNWSSTSLDFRFYDYFNDNANPDRDYLQDVSGDEPTMYQAEDLFKGKYALYVVSIYFMDNDASDTFSEGDDITQVVQTGLREFTLFDVPSIWAYKPEQIEAGNILKIFGVNFGTSQGDSQIYYGTQSDYDNDTGSAFGTTVWSWSNTRIEVDTPALTPGSTLIWIVAEGDLSKKSAAVALEILAP